MPIAVILFFISWSLSWVALEKRSRIQIAMASKQKVVAFISSTAELPLAAE
jgi:hypothetical protein